MSGAGGGVINRNGGMVGGGRGAGVALFFYPSGVMGGGGWGRKCITVSGGGVGLPWEGLPDGRPESTGPCWWASGMEPYSRWDRTGTGGQCTEEGRRDVHIEQVE